jgi:hypothetical protein
MSDLSQIPTDQLMKMYQASQSAPPTDNMPPSSPVTDSSPSYVGNVDPDSGDITVGSGAVQPMAASQKFGFDIPPTNKMVQNKLAAEDSKQRQNYMQNYPLAHNILNSLNEMEPSLDKFPTGGGEYLGWTSELENSIASAFNPKGEMAKAGGNIDKGTNALATDLSKFQYVPGMRGSVLGLKTILGSKPGLSQPPDVNHSMVNDIRGRVTDYLLTQELAQKYRQLSPNQVTDQNTYTLDDALKSVYPLTTTDPKTGQTTFHAENVPLIRQAMDDALANPQKYIKAAESGKQIFGQPSAQKQPGNAAVSQSANQQAAPKLPTFASPDDPGFKSLPSGSQFVGPDGVPRIKH